MAVSLNKTNFIAHFKKPLQWGGGNCIQMVLYRYIKQRLTRKKQPNYRELW